jgi:glycosyltransferase involved in cell wall biosynthesis
MLSWEYPPHVVGGLGRHTAELSPALAQTGVELHLITPVTQPEEATVTTEGGVTVHRVLVPIREGIADVYGRAVQVNQALQTYLQQAGHQYGPFDLIHTHDWLTGFAAVELQAAWKCPLVATIHATERGRNRGHINNDLQRAINEAEQTLVDHARRVIVCSRHMASEVQYFFQAPANKLDIVPNGVNSSDLKGGYSDSSLIPLRANYARPEQQIVFTIARLVYEKGIHLLVEAAPQVLAECPQARFVIAGKGPEARPLKRQAQNLGVADKVKFIGFISDKVRNQLFQVADCAIFPSLYEPFGIVALEAMALGCPVVVSDVGGFSEVVKHAETGIKIYPDNVDSTAWGIVHALDHPNWAQKHAAAARRAVVDLFNWPRIARLTVDVYRRVLEQSAA